MNKLVIFTIFLTFFTGSFTGASCQVGLSPAVFHQLQKNNIHKSSSKVELPLVLGHLRKFEHKTDVALTGNKHIYLKSNASRGDDSSQDDKLKYNIITQEWTFTESGARLKYNPLVRRWQLLRAESRLATRGTPNDWTYAPKGAVMRFNPLTKTWELALGEAQLRFNPFSQSWEYALGKRK